MQKNNFFLIKKLKKYLKCPSLLLTSSAAHYLIFIAGAAKQSQYCKTYLFDS